MERLEFILCHGSGNRFVLLDDRQPLSGPLAEAARTLSAALHTDGLLLLTTEQGTPTMRMFNPDGSEAPMCGNGIRCVARAALDAAGCDRMTIRSGGRPYAVTREEPIDGAIPTFGVEIPVLRSAPELRLPEGFVCGPIPELDAELRFTALWPGNPHVVAAAECIDDARLRRLGERVKELPEIFPLGVNVSLYRREGSDTLYVATYERGAGITFSCGTAMTASATAACLTGLCDFDTPIAVRNRGGMVRCRCRREGESLRTRLVGNATFTADGSCRYAPGRIEAIRLRERRDEIEAYDGFLRRMTQADIH